MTCQTFNHWHWQVPPGMLCQLLTSVWHTSLSTCLMSNLSATAMEMILLFLLVASWTDRNEPDLTTKWKFHMFPFPGHIALSWFFCFHTATEQRWKSNLWCHDTGWWIKIESQWSRIQISYQAFPNSNLWWNSYASLQLFRWYLTKKINNKKHWKSSKIGIHFRWTPSQRATPQSPKTPCHHSSMGHCHPVIVQQLQLHFCDHLPSVSASPVPLGSATC